MNYLGQLFRSFSIYPLTLPNIIDTDQSITLHPFSTTGAITGWSILNKSRFDQMLWKYKGT